jgi:hypothetical protein
MCIAIYKPEGKLLSQETLEQCYNANSDGAGYMFHKSGKLYVKKGFFSFADFWKSYKRDKTKECVLHFRIKTHGLIDKANCHPYNITNDFAFVHNGMISGYTDPNKSDTWLFNEAILQPLVSKWGKLSLFDDPVKKLIEAKIGYSKLIFMDNEGHTEIFNEDKGTWDDGVWYSNSSYKKPAPYVPVAPVTGWMGHYSGQRDKVEPYYSKAVNYYDRQTWAYKKQTVEIGIVVQLHNGLWDKDTQQWFGKDIEWEIVAVNGDYSVDLITYDTEDPRKADFLYNIRFSDFEIVLEEEDPVGDNEADGFGQGDIYDYRSI